MQFQLAQRKWQPYALLLFRGCMPLDEGLSERQGMTLDEYKTFVGKSASDSLIMPERASKISHGSLSGRDSWNTWWKIEGVDATTKTTLISTLAKQLEKTGFFRVGEDAQTQKNRPYRLVGQRPAKYDQFGGRIVQVLRSMRGKKKCNRLAFDL